MTPTLARADVGGSAGNASLTVADLPLGTYTLTFRGGSSGGFNLDVLLQGDVNGDRVVNRADSDLLNAAYGRSAGQPGYRLEADANRDGLISSYDRSQTTRNQSDQLRISPLSLTATVSPTGSIVGGVVYTNTTVPTFQGQAAPHATIGFDVNGDGTDETTATADASGQYSKAVAVPLGASTMTVRARDPFGQTSTRQVRLMVDLTPPPVPTWTLAPESDAAPLGDNTTTYRFVNLNGTGAEPGVRLDTGPGTRQFTANADGTFRITDLALEAGDNTVTVRAIDAAGNVSTFARVIVRNVPNDAASPAFAWNEAMLEAGRLNADAPPQAARAYAMVSAAMYDALNAVNGASSFLFARVPAPAMASAPAALIAAARRVMDYLYAGQSSTFAALYDAQIGAIPAGQSRSDGIAVGEQVADIIIDLRQNDGSRDFVQYFPNTSPGRWQPTGPSFAPALLPQWADVTPFAMSSPGQFRPAAGPNELSSAPYAADLNEVKSLGSATSTTRTAEQTAIARFWADGAGTYTPAGHWNQIATSIAQSQGMTLFDTARLMAQLNVALADASIVAWNAKYAFNQWRPFTAIRNADGSAALGGTFRAHFVGGYEPVAGDIFSNLLTFGSFTGAFSLIEASGLPVGLSLLDRYNPNSFSLEIA